MEFNKRLFFKRQRDQRGDWPRTFRTDHFPEETRQQCWIAFSTIGYARDFSKNILTSLAQEIGSLHLFPVPQHDSENKLYNFFISGLQDKNDHTKLDYAFTVLEMMCQAIQEYEKMRAIETCKPSQHSPSEHIAKINQYLREGGVGYKYLEEAEQLVSVDDENVTSDFIQPAISILNQPVFEGSYAYIQNAFQQYRGGHLAEALDNTVKGCEALLKCIFDKKKGIDYDKETYMPLLEKASQAGLFPAISGDKLSPLVNEFKALGELRNKEGGHGKAGLTIQTRHVRLALHHALANMMFIAESFLERR